jgi:hypothetical protein
MSRRNAIVTGTQVSYTPSSPLSGGHHTVTVQVADNVGNVSAVRTAGFDIDESGPVISSFTIGGAPAVDGMYVTSSLQPVFVVNYTDDTGINVSASRLLFAPQGQPLVQVPSTITQTSLTYQPPSLLAEGQYAVQAILTNDLGTSTTTSVINFTLDVDAPDITSVSPSTGSQHGGTTVTITGARLLSTTGAAPGGNDWRLHRGGHERGRRLARHGHRDNSGGHAWAGHYQNGHEPRHGGSGRRLHLSG